MKYSNTIEEVREGDIKAKALNGNGRTAVIVETEFSAGMSNYGTQFWTEEMIKAGASENTDRTKSKFVEKL